jgi:hypothetical protein
MSGSRPNPPTSLLVGEQPCRYSRVEAPGRSPKSCRESCMEPLEHMAPRIGSLSKEEEEASQGTRVGDAAEVAEEVYPTRSSRTWQQHGKPCLQPCRRLSRPTQTPPAPAQPGSPHSHQATPLGVRLWHRPLEQISSVPRKWHEHHEKKGRREKRGFMVFRCPHLQWRGEPRTTAGIHRGPTRV